MFVLAGLLPGLGPGKVADRLNNSTLQGVVLAGGLAALVQRISIKNIILWKI